jgi:Ser/Thr protein kinase RdoA (MazF antagonist)
VGPAEVRDLLVAGWDLAADHVEPLAGGMNSATWQVRSGADRWVVKTVTPRDRATFTTGLRAAAVVEAAGLPAGAPVPTTSGGLCVDGPEGVTALLAWVAGAPLDGADTAEVETIGRTLGRAHRALAGADVRGAAGFDWVDPDAPHLDVQEWVRPAVRDALAGWTALRPRVRAWSLLHGDPSPEAFLVTADGCALIDWASCVHGPCLSDLASALMYVGRAAATPLVTAYLSQAPTDPAEVEEGLLAMLRLRWAVQADYFARRLAENDLTGIEGEADNRKGLDDARRALGPGRGA